MLCGIRSREKLGKVVAGRRHSPGIMQGRNELEFAV